MTEKVAQQPVTLQNPRSDSSRKFFKFMPYSAATNAPEPIPRVPMENLRSRSIRELRLASRIALTLSKVRNSKQSGR